MTDLYAFLKNLMEQAEGPNGTAVISDEQWKWMEHYMKAPDMLLNFKAASTGITNEKGEPIYRQDFQIAGEPVDIHSLVTEAMLQNHQFADVVVSAAMFYREHVPKCPICAPRHFGDKKPVLDWNFKPHNPGNDETSKK